MRDKLLWSVHLVLGTVAASLCCPTPLRGSPVPRSGTPPCRAPCATGTSGTRKSDSTGATRPYKPEIQYGYNKRCVLKLRSLRYHYNDREDRQKNKNRE